VLDQAVDLVDVQEAVAERPRHVVVHLGDDQLGGVRGGLGDVHRDAEAAIPVAVRRADHDQGDVDRNAVGLEQFPTRERNTGV